MWEIRVTKEAKKDMKKLSSVEPHVREKVRELLERISEDPYFQPPPYKILGGNFSGALSRKINDKDRLVYQVLEEERIVKLIYLLTHYRD